MKISVWLFAALICLPLAAGEDYTLYKQGKKAWYGKDWDEAGTLFNKVIQDYPESHFYHNSLYFLGNCRYRQKKYTAAFDNFSEYLESSVQDSVFQDAEELRLRSAFELAKTRDPMKNVLREGLSHKDTDLALLSASLLLQLNEKDVFDPLFDQLEKAGSPRVRQKLYSFIKEHGGQAEYRRLRPYRVSEERVQSCSKGKMLHLIIQSQNDESVNICIPLSFAEYFRDVLSDEQIKRIEKNSNHKLSDLIERAETMKKGDLLIKIQDGDGNLIKLVVD